MTRNNYGSLGGRRAGGAVWQWLIIGGILGFGCAVIVLLVGFITGLVGIGGTSLANAPTPTAQIIVVTATAAPATATLTPTVDLSTDVPLEVNAPTPSPTILPTLLTLPPTQQLATQSLIIPTSTSAPAAFNNQQGTGGTGVTGGQFDRLVAVGTRLVPVAGGQFNMGTTVAEVTTAVNECAQGYGGEPGTCLLSYGEDSFPAHLVTVSPFQMEVTEVTYDQYLTFLNIMGPGSHRNGCLGQPCMQTTTDSETSNVTFDSQNYNVNAAVLNFPVTNVTWYGAQAYCQAIGRRLPTEAEWERAARGDLGYIYPWGNTWDPANSASRRSIALTKVAIGSFPLGASPYSVLDMAGNVSEWVSDWYSPSYYGRPEAAGPDPAGPATGTEKVTRGGSWDTVPFFTRTMHRRSLDPIDANAETGFRCVADANSAALAGNTTGAPLGANIVPTPDPALLGAPAGGSEEAGSGTGALPQVPAIPGADTNAAPTMPARPTAAAGATLNPGG
ncbi:MAG: formylglycine-generating enzyme family protein [Pleurocapsa minor GSE-CHR-MK-17-07R]|jgi:formylglycine-generating enzyme required for sulfatase activity|nr:formylglycine-generating enzyme family protein [Pleurocapsa minor GSE-CHR-MK 17-07R]